MYFVYAKSEWYYNNHIEVNLHIDDGLYMYNTTCITLHV